MLIPCLHRFIESMSTVMQQEVMAVKNPSTDKTFAAEGVVSHAGLESNVPHTMARCHFCGCVGHYKEVCEKKGKNT